MDIVIESNAYDAARERLWSHTVGIANRALVRHGTDPATGLRAIEQEAPGTGFAGVWGRHHFILTANHVLDEAQLNDLSFFVRQTGHLVSRRASEVKMEDGVVAVPLNDPDAAIHRCEWEDLAILTIEPDALGPKLEFFDVGSSWVDPPKGEMVVGVGYPVAGGVRFEKRVGSVLEKAVLLNPTMFGGAVLPCPDEEALRFIKGFDPNRHYRIPYEHAKAGKGPEGISGAAAWVKASEEHMIWAPRFKFAGICTSCYKDGTVEQIVKASVVRQFLLEVFGGAEK
jgi:hypothetical protein